NPPLEVATSVPVVTVTFRAPVVAVAEIVMLAVALVALATLTLLTVMPLPKLALVTPWAKFVDWPVRPTDRVAPCLPEFGLIPVSVGVPPVVTVNELSAVAVSVPVVTVTLRTPVAALDAITMVADALVALATLTLFTVMPAPKLAVVVP